MPISFKPVFVALLVAAWFSGNTFAQTGATSTPQQAPKTARQVQKILPSYEGQNVSSVELAGRPDITQSARRSQPPRAWHCSTASHCWTRKSEWRRSNFSRKSLLLQGGTIDLVNPSRTEPVVNVSVNTSIQQYNIQMHFWGSADHLHTNYSSDPALPPSDVINLVAFGKTKPRPVSPLMPATTRTAVSASTPKSTRRGSDCNSLRAIGYGC